MFKSFLQYYKPHKKLLVFDLMAAMVLSAVDLVFPMLTRNIVDQHIPDKDMGMIMKIALFLLALFIIRAGCSYFMNYWGHVMGARMEYDMRRDLFKHYLTLSFKFYDEQKTGKLMSRLVNDLRDISEMAHHAPEDALIGSIMILGSLGLLLTINVPLTLILLLLVSILMGYSMYKRLHLREAFRNQRLRSASINAQVENSLSGIRLCQSYANEGFEEEKFDVVNVDLYESRKDAFKTMGEFAAGTGFLEDLMNLGIVTAGGFFVIKGWITVGDLFAYLLFTSFFMRPIRRVISMIQQLQSGFSGFERFYEIVTMETDIKNPLNPVVPSQPKGNIQFEAVSFAYDDTTPVLDRLDLDIPHGKHIALVGPSGVGKSTITNLIPRFYDVTDGAIKIDGHDVRDWDIASLRQTVGIVQQEVFMFHGTIRDNILYGNPDATDQMIIEAASHAFIHDFIMSLPEGYDTMVGERGVKLSGGQKQRLSIARVFLKNPPIVILDEATSSLDNESELFVQKALQGLMKGKTSITVAHRLSTIMDADEILVLEGNKVVERGAHQDLLALNGTYYKLYTAQFKGFMPDDIIND